MDSIPQTSGIYKITCVPTGKIYIGSAVNLRKRWGYHQSDLRLKRHCNIHLQRAWDKYGEDAFVFDVIELVLLPFILEREQYWLDRTQAFKRGFNRSPTAGSPLGVKRSAETIEKIRAATTGRKQSRETIEKRISALRGRKRNPAIGAKISAVRQGHRPTEEARRNMSAAQSRRTDLSKEYIVTDPNGNEYLIRNLEKFCREHGLIRSAMYMTMIGRIKQHRGGWKCRLA